MKRWKIKKWQSAKQDVLKSCSFHGNGMHAAEVSKPAKEENNIFMQPCFILLDLESNIRHEIRLERNYRLVRVTDDHCLFEGLAYKHCDV